MRVNGWNGRKLAAWLLVVLAVVVLSACGGKNNETQPPASSPQSAATPQATSTPDGAGKTEEPQPPLELSMLVNNLDAPVPGNEVETLIEEHTNTVLNVQWITDMKDKLPVLIASGDMPKAISFGNSQLRLPYMVSAMRADVFWELSPYIEDYPNLASINPLIFENTSLDGKVYGLPVVRPLARYAVTYRKDWMNELGMAEPSNVNEFYELAKAFAGHKSSSSVAPQYGILEFKTMSLVEHLTVWLGGPNGWGVKDGEFIADHLTDEYFEALQLTKRMYDEKILNQDFAVMEKNAWEASFTSGHAGMLINITDTPLSWSDKMQSAVPGAELDAFSVLESAAGPRSTAGNGSNGVVVFPKSSVKTEAELRRVLAFFDALADEEMATLLKWGIEGTHFEVKDGKAAYIDEKSYRAAVSPYTKLMAQDDRNALPGEEPPLAIKAREMDRANEAAAVVNPTESLISQTQAERGSDLAQVVFDAKVKFIMGRIDEAGWRAEIDKWRSGGGDQMAKEYAGEYAKKQ